MDVIGEKMKFSNEDRQCWDNSEVIAGLERIAASEGWNSEEVSLDWEDENFKEALIEFEKPNSELLEEDLTDEISLAYDLLLVDNLKKIASKSNIKVAYMIEQVIYEIQDLLNCPGGKK